jgi:hypothetical protein
MSANNYKFFKRRFRTDLPTLDPFFNPVQIEEKGRKRLKIGDKVRIQNAVSKRWDDFGVVCDIRDSGRSYYIDRGRGRDVILRDNIFLNLIAPPPSAKRAGEEEESCLASGSLCEKNAVENLQTENSSMHAVRRSLCIKNKKGEKNCLSSGSLREKNAVKTHISPGSLPLHRPAVAEPAAREPKRESTRVRKQTVRFAP